MSREPTFIGRDPEIPIYEIGFTTDGVPNHCGATLLNWFDGTFRCQRCIRAVPEEYLHNARRSLDLPTPTSR